jgi:hypothetical protein
MDIEFTKSLHHIIVEDEGIEVGTLPSTSIIFSLCNSLLFTSTSIIYHTISKEKEALSHLILLELVSTSTSMVTIGRKSHLTHRKQESK